MGNVEHAHLSGVEQEWLRRIALKRLLAIVPAQTADALVAIGFAEMTEDGSLTASVTGRRHLDTRGISLALRRKKHE